MAKKISANSLRVATIRDPDREIVLGGPHISVDREPAIFRL